MQPIKITDVLKEEEVKDLINNIPDLKDAFLDVPRFRFIKDNDYITNLGKHLESLAKKVFKENNIKSS